MKYPRQHFKTSLPFLIPLVVWACAPDEGGVEKSSSDDVEDSGAGGTAAGGTMMSSGGSMTSSGGSMTSSGGSSPMGGLGGTDGSGGKCNPGAAGKDCSPCQAGQFCPGGDEPPVNCTEGDTFDDDDDPATDCQPLTQCKANERVATPSTSTSDRICVACSPGSIASPTDSGICVPAQEYSVVEVGGQTVCAIRVSDSKAECWAGNRNNQASTVPDAQFSSLAGGTDAFCGILKDSGKPRCWGNDSGGIVSAAPDQILTGLTSKGGFFCGLDDKNFPVCWGSSVPTPPVSTAYKVLASRGGNAYTCGIQMDDVVDCWGDNYQSQASPPADLKLKELDVAFGNACGIKNDPGQADDGHVTCWGTQTPKLRSDAPTEPLKQLGLLYGAACALRESDSSVVCWGGWQPMKNIPTGAFASLSVGSDFACAQRANGDLECWGDNRYLQLDPVIPATFDEYFTAPGVVCGLTDGGHECWGDDGYGVVDNYPDKLFSDLSLDSASACAIRTLDNKIECWGTSPGKLSSDTPSLEVSAIAHSSTTGCALSLDTQKPVCWGDSAPLPGLPDIALSSVAMTIDWTAPTACGLRVADNKPECWGNDINGVVTNQPDQPLSNLVSGFRVMCGISLADGKPLCWGSGTNDLIKDLPDTSISALAANSSTACGLLDTGVPICWGSDWANIVSKQPDFALKNIFLTDNMACGETVAEGEIFCWGNVHLL